MKLYVLVWAKFHRRSELLAQHFNGEVHYICNGRQNKLWHAPLRYAIQTVRTYISFLNNKPEYVLVQNPPFPCVFIVYLYTIIFNKKMIIDSHTGAFIDKNWKWSLPLHKYISKKSFMTIVHNDDQERIIEHWNCNYMNIGFIPDMPKKCNLKSSTLPGFNITVILTYKFDEPIEAILECVKMNPDVNFYFTGDSYKFKSNCKRSIPENCNLTGYLSYDDYISLLKKSDAILVLTKRNHTLLMGGFEAVANEKPLITSNWPILKKYFTHGTIHVGNEPADISKGIHTLRINYKKYQNEIVLLHSKLKKDWNLKKNYLYTLLKT